MNEARRIMIEAQEWLKLHKCYKCKNQRAVSCVYRIDSKKNGTWKCQGYKRSFRKKR